MPDDAPLRWLIFEGLVPVFGAGALYLLYGFCRKLAAARPLAFAWKEAFDAMGGLYCALIILIQAALKCAASQQFVLLWVCLLCAILVGVLLLSAMGERGTDPAWRARPWFKAVALILAIFSLCSGYLAEALGWST